MEKPLETDVLIIGGGITGAGIARELSRYKVDTILVEKAGYISAGQTKASLGTLYGEGLLQVASLVVKSAYAPDAPVYEPESLKMQLIRDGFEMWPQILDELDIQFKREPLLVIAINKKQVTDLEKQLRMGQSIGGRYADMRWVDKKAIFASQPYLVKNAIAGLYSEFGYIKINPWDPAIALADNAKQNGVRVILDAEVTGVSQKDGYQLVKTAQGSIKTRFIVNAAGLFADVVADMGGARDWGLTNFRHLFIITDKRLGRYFNSGIMSPAVPGEMDGYTVTLEGNVLISVVREWLAQDKYHFGFDRHEYMEVMRVAKRYSPKISERDVIRAFVPVAAFNTRDPEAHIIEPSSTNPRFINVAIRMPGLSPSPAIARYVVNLLGEAGLELTTRPDFNPYRKAIPRFRDLTDDARAKLITQDSRYGRVICRCETITEGEIVEAVKRGARTVAGVKYMTRAGMGRCQSGFCGPRVVSIIARELNIPVTEVRDFGTGSPVLPYRSKELLQETAV